MHSDALHTARSSACRLLETCTGSTVEMLIYRRKSVGEMTPPCGTPSRIFMLFLKSPSSFTLADLSCRKHRIHLYILPETRSQVSSTGKLHARLYQKLLLGRRKQKQPFSFLERHSLSLGQWGSADLLYFCVSDIQSVLVTVYSALRAFYLFSLN